MVYKIASDGIGRGKSVYQHQKSWPRSRSQATSRRPPDPLAHLQLSQDSWLAGALVAGVHLCLVLYDLLSWPLYVLVGRVVFWRGPQAAAGRFRVEMVDSRTWIKLAEGAATGARPSHRHLGNTLEQIFRKAVQVYGERPCLGYRALVSCPVMSQDELGDMQLVERSFRSDFTWYTFDQVGRRVLDLATGMHRAGVQPGEGAFLLVLEPSLEWFCAAQALFQLAAHLVVAPEVRDPPSLARVLADCEAATVVTCCGRLAVLAELLLEQPHSERAQRQVRRVILTDWQFRVDASEPLFARFLRRTSGLKVELMSLCQLEESGTSTMVEGPHQQPGQPLGPIAWAALEQVHGRPQASERRLALVVFSHSQVAGQLSRLALSHRHLARSHHHLFLDGGLGWLEPPPHAPARCHLASQPLDNLLELMLELWVFSGGGSLGYSASSQETLLAGSPGLFERDKSDLEALEPTHLLLRPYELEQVRAALESHLSLRLSPLKGFLLANLVRDYKRRWPSCGGGCGGGCRSTPLASHLFCGELRRLFGTRIRCILCDGRADCGQTREFFHLLLDIPLLELQGPPEALASLISVPYCQLTRAARSRSRKVAGEPRQPREHDFFHHLQLLPARSDPNGPQQRDTSLHLVHLSGSLFAPTLGTRLRLEDWQDFRSSDLPLPRGRLLLAGRHLPVEGQPGHAPHLEPDPDSPLLGWLRTDQLVQLHPQSGSLELISAISDMIRMHDGQLVSLSQVEHLLRASPFVDNLCAVCADDRQFVVVLVVPNLLRLARKSFGSPHQERRQDRRQDRRRLHLQLELEPEPEELLDLEFRREACNDRLMCEFVSAHLASLLEGAQLDLRRLQVQFHLVADIWAPDSELATPLHEPKRAQIKKFYAAELASILAMRHAPASSSRRLRSSQRHNR